MTTLFQPEIGDCVQNFAPRTHGGAYSFDEAASSGRLGIDPVNAQACLTELRTYACLVSPVLDHNLALVRA